MIPAEQNNSKRSEFRIWLARTFGRSDVRNRVTVKGVVITFILTIVYFAWAAGASISSIILYFLLRPTLGLVPATKVVNAIVESFFIYQVWMFQHYCKSNTILYGDRIPYRESAFVIGNHQWLVDFGIIFCVGVRKGMAGATKFFAKKSVLYIPFIGLGVWIHGGVFLNRNWDRDKDSIRKCFSRQRQLKGKVPLWVVTWPESTRLCPEKIELSHKFAEENGLPKWNNVLIPRTKGFIAQVKGLREIVPYLYDFTVGYGGPKHEPPTPLDMGLGGYGNSIHIHCRRYLMSDLPESDEELKKWLFDRWQEKEDLLTYFKKHDKFPEEPLNDPFRIIPIWKSVPKDD